jgi:hypothetical protein
MNIYTDNFSNIRNYTNNSVPISIARWSPKWYSGIRYLKWAPSIELLTNYKDGIITQDQYVSEFITNLLLTTDIVEDVNEIFHLVKGKSISLCCYENSSDFCHRHIVAYLINEYIKLNRFSYPIYVCGELVKGKRINECCQI